jgi:hypothetical protein
MEAKEATIQSANKESYLKATAQKLPEKEALLAKH